jgi:methyl-accepting chemotaxis protein
MAITEMDSVTQQNAALVEEAAAAASSLEEQSTALAELVSRFNVGGSVTRVAVRKPAATRVPAPRVAFAAAVIKPRSATAPARAGAEEWETF